jgi:hypothetical protein
MFRPLKAAALAFVALVVASGPWSLSAAAAGPSLRTAEAGTPPGAVTAIILTLPADVAAVDGRLLVAGRSAELLGVAPLGGGTGLRPAPFPGGASFGAYDLRPTGGAVHLALAVVPRTAGRLSLRVVVDSAATRNGHRVALHLDAVTTLTVGGRDSRGGQRRSAAPAAAAGPRPTGVAGTPRELVPDGRFTRRDLDTARLAWLEARDTGRPCGTPEGDANGDGCTDIVDVQATLARLGTRTDVTSPAIAANASNASNASNAHRPRRRADGMRTFIVASPEDTPDAAPGDGICGDDQGRCTFRAALMEADWLRGDDRIAFDLPGDAPVQIALRGSLPIITSRSGTLTIDGYTQPGARVNTADVGSNAVPGVELRGNGSDAREAVIRITSGGNTVRGLLIRGAWRPFFLDGTGATGNRIVGNWIGLDGDGTVRPSTGRWGILVNTGANGNRIGGPDPADRNVIGDVLTAIDLYGPGTDGNVVQNNLLCMGPSGRAATCRTGIDHNFGPKVNVVGGDAPAERNVIGPTVFQGIELSHGWDPALPWGTDTSTTWQVNGNRVLGNWVGFRADGSYDPDFRSGLELSPKDNGNGINVYDGVNDSLVAGNWVASAHDGIQVQAPNATRNVVRDNIIGQSPLGEPAPLGGWGIIVRWNTRHDTVVGNTIRHAELGGIGLVHTTNLGADLAPATSIRISRNIVTDTPGIAIDLFGVGGPDPNDPGDADSGANTLLNTPEITGVDSGIVTGTADPGASVELYRTTRAAGENGLPVAFLGETVAGADGAWQLAAPDLTAGDRVAALQILPDDNTSELSSNLRVEPEPGPETVLAADDFGRKVTRGWGTADLGGRWLVAAAGASVRGGAGRLAVRPGSTRNALLPIHSSDVSVTGRVVLVRLPAGGSLVVDPFVRATRARGQRAAIRVAPTGEVFVRLQSVASRVAADLTPEVAAGLTVARGGSLAFRLEAAGPELRVRVWDPAGPEPDGWLATATPASAGSKGGVGIAVAADATVTGKRVTVLLDDFRVTPTP